MNTLKSWALAAFAACFLWGPATAENLALIISNLEYRNQPDLSHGRAINQIERRLRDADFFTFHYRNQRSQSLAERVGRLQRRISDADRVVVVVAGHIVHTSNDTWLLSPGAGTPNPYTVGLQSLPLSALLNTLSAKQGAAAILLAEPAQRTRVRDGVTAGAGDVMPPYGLTVVKGGAERLRDFVADGLLSDSMTMAQAVATHRGVSASGFVSSTSSFLPLAGGFSEIVSEPEPEPELSREQILAEIEAALGLSRSDRGEVQQNLAILGFNPGGIDGLLGPGSRRAIRTWQVDRGFEPTGYLNKGQLDLLRLQGAARAAELEAEAERKRAEQEARDTAYWRSTGSGTDEAGMRAYLRRHPEGLFAEVARERLEELEEARRPTASPRERRDWRNVTENDHAAGYRAYLERYPNGVYRAEAEARLAELSIPKFSEAQLREFQANERRVAGNSVTRRLVENRLTALGLEPGPSDGRFDDDTRRALRKFQGERGLNVTGYVNQATMVRILLGE